MLNVSLDISLSFESGVGYSTLYPNSFGTAALTILCWAFAEDEAGRLLWAPDRGRERDELEVARDLPQPLEPDRELDAPLALDQVVQLVDHDGLDGREVPPHPRAREYRLKRLGRRDQEVGRRPGLPLPLRQRRVAVPHVDRERESGAPDLQAPQHVPVQRPERRDVDDGDSVAVTLLDEPAQRGQHRRLGLP